MAYSTINKGSSFMNPVLYTGNSTVAQSITGVGFQPDATWIKIRNDTRKHNIYDAVRGVTKRLVPNDDVAEDTVNGVTAFNSDGFSVGNETDCNQGSNTFVSWNWKAGTTSGIATNGSTTITPSSYSFNQSAGFSVIKYTGNATAGAKVAHGLGAVPGLIIVKVLDASNNWAVYHKEMGATKAMYLDNNNAETTDGWLNNTAPDDVNFTLSGGNYGNTANTHIAYCFAEVGGYSKFGSYIGNGNDVIGGGAGTFIYTGFKPSFMICKKTNGADDWRMLTENVNTRNTATNEVNKNLYAQSTAAESGTSIDFVSNGMKIYTTTAGLNGNGDTYIYIAFGQPIISNGGVCATAR